MDKKSYIQISIIFGIVIIVAIVYFNYFKNSNLNNVTTFSGYVKMTYSDHKVISENLDLSFRDKTAVLYDKVDYTSNLTNLSADRILIDFISKNTRIEMEDEKNNILVRSRLKNVGN